MIWHHTRRRTHKQLAPKPEPPEGMMWNPAPKKLAGEFVPIGEVERICQKAMAGTDDAIRSGFRISETGLTWVRRA